MSNVWKHVFWDFDGTIADTSEGIVCCVHYAFDQLGIERPKEEKIRKNIGPPLRKIMEMLLCSTEEYLIDEAVLLFRERYSDKGWREMKLFDGVRDTLKELSGKGKKNYIVTLKPQKFVDIIVDDLNIRTFFEDILGDDLSSSVHNKSSFIKELLEKHSIDAKDAVMIGDRAEDCLSAKKNGLDTIGVTYGFDTLENLKRCGNDILVSSAFELMEIL